MSGIIGYLGTRRALPVLMQGLKLMQNVSYDSVGLILKKSDHFFVKKKVGTVIDLERDVISYGGLETMGAAHMRWATHGAVEARNAHPIFDCQGRVAVLHKGTVDNYAELKKKLEAEGHTFMTNTDTEVISHLIEKYYQGDLPEAVRKSLMEVIGTYSLIVMNADEKQEMIVANAGMGTLIGVGENEYFVGLSQGMLYPFTDKVVFLCDGEMSIINESGMVSSVIAGGAINVVTKDIEKISFDSAKKQEYLEKIDKEIFEQPEMVKNTLAGRMDQANFTAHFGGLVRDKDWLRKINRLMFVGSGSSYYASLLARELIEDYVAVGVSVYSGWEMRAKRFAVSGEDTAMFVMSQSGETEDTVKAMREAIQLGLSVYGITNTVGGTIARETKSGIFLHSGPTLGIPSMRSFMSQITALVLLTIFLGRLKGLSPSSGKEILRSLNELPNQLSTILENSAHIRNIASKYRNVHHLALVGMRYSYPIALEAALALSKTTRLTVQAMQASEINYGLMDQVGNEWTMIFLLTQDDMLEVFQDQMKQAREQGAKVLVFASERMKVDDLCDDVIYVPSSKDIVMPMMILMALQLWIYYFNLELMEIGQSKAYDGYDAYQYGWTKD